MPDTHTPTDRLHTHTPRYGVRAPRPSPTVVQLADYAAWDAFAEANADALIARFGSVEFALQTCLDGGITLDDGRGGSTLICFEDRP